MDREKGIESKLRSLRGERPEDGKVAAAMACYVLFRGLVPIGQMET